MIEDLLTIHELSRPGRKSRRPKRSITLHWTQWPKATAKMVRDNWEFKKTLEIHRDPTGDYVVIKGEKTLTADLFGSAHICVDSDTELLAVPLNEDAYHTGVPIGNETSIGIELAVLDMTGRMAPEVVERAVKLCARLCVEHSIDPGKILRHYDWSQKVCPRWYVEHPGDFEQFKKDVKDLLRPA